MSAFSPEWLLLREPADLRARNRDVSSALSARFQLRSHIAVADLGAGTGANLRAVAPLLPERQTWTLIDHDQDLLDKARTELSSWATQATADNGTLRLTRDQTRIDVHFSCQNLGKNLEGSIPDGTDLITASAFFDLVSAHFMRELVRLAAHRGAAVYASLTYNGNQRWTPHRPADNQITSAFHRHMMRDKGMGVAAGPVAAAELVEQLQMGGFSVIEGDSPWSLGRGDRMLIEELVRGQAIAVTETGLVDGKTVTDWVNLARSAAVIGHADVFAVPVAGSDPDASV